MIGSTEKLKEHLIINNKLLDVPVNEDRFTVLYSIQVQQRALSKEGYEYYLNVQQQNEEMGGIFTPQPSESQGNISCISQPGRRTIGYVGVYKTSLKREYTFIPTKLNVLLYTVAVKKCRIAKWMNRAIAHI